MRKPTRFVGVLLISLIATAGVAAAPKDADVQDVVILAPNRPIFARLHVTIDGKPVHQAWNEFFKNLFVLIDADNDRKLNADELKRVPAATTLFGAVNPPPAGDIDRTRVTALRTKPATEPFVLEDLIDYYRRNGVAPVRIAGGSSQVDLSVDALLDIDVTRSYTPYGAMGPSAEELTIAFLGMLDADRDGRLSSKELKAAEDGLLKRDFDEDEILTTFESIGNLGNAINPWSSPRYPGIGISMKSSLGRNVVTISTDAPSAALAQMLLRVYNRPKQEKNAKALTRAEIDLEPSVFAKLDADHNKRLDASELAKFAVRAPDVEMTFEVGAKPKVARLIASKAKALKECDVAFPQGIRVVKEDTVDLGSASVRFSIGASANNLGGKYSFVTVQYQQSVFRPLDRDGNGYLDKKEARGNSIYLSNFDLMDADKDGMLFPKEIEAYFKKWNGLQAKAQAATVTLSLFEEGQGFFGMLDANADGRLSVREMRKAPALLAKHDRDKDGCLSRGEIPLSYHVSLTKGTSVNALYWYPQQTARRPAVPPPAATATPLWFRKMDRNHDGDVSLREFVGNDKAFARMDADGDRLLSADEATKADAALRRNK